MRTNIFLGDDFMTVFKAIVVCASVGALGGCAAAAIPLNIAAANAMTDNTMSNVEQIPNMNCSQLRERWEEVSNPVMFMNPFRSAPAERSLIRQYAAQRGCRMPS